MVKYCKYFCYGLLSSDGASTHKTSSLYKKNGISYKIKKQQKRIILGWCVLKEEEEGEEAAEGIRKPDTHSFYYLF